MLQVLLPCHGSRRSIVFCSTYRDYRDKHRYSNRLIIYWISSMFCTQIHHRQFLRDPLMRHSHMSHIDWKVYSGLRLHFPCLLTGHKKLSPIDVLQKHFYITINLYWNKICAQNFQQRASNISLSIYARFPHLLTSFLLRS